MASSLPRRSSRHLLSSSTFSSSSSLHRLTLLLYSFRSLTTTTTATAHVAFNLGPEGGREGPDTADSNPQQRPQQQRLYFERPLENGLDQGFYKADMCFLAKEAMSKIKPALGVSTTFDQICVMAICGRWVNCS